MRKLYSEKKAKLGIDDHKRFVDALKKPYTAIVKKKTRSVFQEWGKFIKEFLNLR